VHHINLHLQASDLPFAFRASVFSPSESLLFISFYSFSLIRSLIFQITVELQLSGLIGKASHPDMQKTRIIGFSFKIGYLNSLKFGCYYLQYALRLNLSKTPDLNLEATTLYCT